MAILKLSTVLFALDAIRGCLILHTYGVSSRAAATIAIVRYEVSYIRAMLFLYWLFLNDYNRGADGIRRYDIFVTMVSSIYTTVVRMPA